MLIYVDFWWIWELISDTFRDIFPTFARMCDFLVFYTPPIYNPQFQGFEDSENSQKCMLFRSFFCDGF